MNLGALYLGYPMNCLKCRKQFATKVNIKHTRYQLIATYKCKECWEIIFVDRYQKNNKMVTN